MKKITLIFFISFVFCGKPFDTAEKGLFALYTSLQIADIYTTNEGIQQGYYDLNPVYGKHPHLSKLILYKSVFLIGSYYLLKKSDSGIGRKIALTVLDFAYIYLVCRNYRQIK